MKKDIIYFSSLFFIFILFIFLNCTKEVHAEENIIGNNYLVSVDVSNIDHEPVTESLEGVSGYLSLQLLTPNQVIEKDSTMSITIPKDIEISQHKTYKITDSNTNEVGDVTVNQEEINIRFTDQIAANSLLKITDIFYSFTPVEETGSVTLDFGNNIQKKILINNVDGEGNFNWKTSPNLSPINDVSYWSEHILVNKYKAVASEDILKDSPDYKGVGIASGFKYPAYYFFGQDAQGNYLPHYFATCIDLFHTIALLQDVPMVYSNVEDYVEADAVERISLYMQMATMLAEEKGMIINSDGKKIPIEFTNDEQQAYMFTGQYLGWMQSLMYNKNAKYRINNVTTKTLKAVSSSGSEVDLSKYINEIEQLVKAYDNLDYIPDETIKVELNQPKQIVSIPENQQKFIHYIDKNLSENLDLVDGIDEVDFENFNELTVKPNQKFSDKQVKIVIKKKTSSFWNNVLDYTGLRYKDSAVQYKSMVGLLGNEIKTKTIVLSMDKKTEITVKKSWQDNNNQDGIRPNKILVQLHANGTPMGEPVALNGANKWTYTWQDLAEKENGDPITYTVEEVDKISGYEISVNNADNENIVISNTHTPEKTAIKGEKTWSDNNNQDGIRPDQITVNLLANGILVDQKIVTEKENWQYSFTDLDKYEAGKEIIYTVTENDIPNYSTTITNTNITNQYTPNKTSATVIKSWQDSNNQDGIRPEQILVQLYANDTASGEPVALNEANKWTYTWQDLAEKENGNLIAYTVKEVDNIPGYEGSINNEDIGNIMISNTHTPEKTAIKGEKTWSDNNNQDGIRPDQITVNLLANGILVDQKIVTEKENWQYSFTDLDKYEAGKEIIYTVTENDIPNYSTTITNTNIINQYTPNKTSATVTKSWQDSNNQDDIRPEQILVQLYANDTASGEPVALNEANKWTYTWQDLAEKENGNPITYTVKEVDEVSGYETIVDDTNIGNILISNIHTPERIGISTQAHTGDGKEQTFVWGADVQFFDDVELIHENIPLNTKRAYETKLHAIYTDNFGKETTEVVWTSGIIDYTVTDKEMTEKVIAEYDYKKDGKANEKTRYFFSEDGYNYNEDTPEKDVEHNPAGTEKTQQIVPIQLYPITGERNMKILSIIGILMIASIGVGYVYLNKNNHK